MRPTIPEVERGQSSSVPSGLIETLGAWKMKRGRAWKVKRRRTIPRQVFSGDMGGLRSGGSVAVAQFIAVDRFVGGGPRAGRRLVARFYFGELAKLDRQRTPLPLTHARIAEVIPRGPSVFGAADRLPLEVRDYAKSMVEWDTYRRWRLPQRRLERCGFFVIQLDEAGVVLGLWGEYGHSASRAGYTDEGRTRFQVGMVHYMKSTFSAGIRRGSRPKRAIPAPKD